MYKVVVYEDDEVVFTKTMDSSLKEISIKTSNKDIKFTIEEKTRPKPINTMLKFR